MEAPNKYSNERGPGCEHVPIYPKGFIAIRIVQLVLSLAVLGLTAFGVTIIAFNTVCFNIFVAVATLITCVYYIVAEFGAKSVYNYWAVLSLDIFLVIFWLIAFALLATTVSVLSAYVYCDYQSDCDAYAAILATAAAVGGVEFVLFIVSLAIHSVALHKHRKAGLHCTPGASTAVQVSHPTVAPVAVNTEKPISQPQMKPENQQYPQQYAQQGYAQPTYVGQPTAPPQQQYYPQQVPQQSPSPLSSQPTGASVVQQQSPVHYQQGPGPVQPVYEADGQRDQGPFEVHEHGVQPRTQ